MTRAGVGLCSAVPHDLSSAPSPPLIAKPQNPRPKNSEAEPWTQKAYVQVYNRLEAMKVAKAR